MTRPTRPFSRIICTLALTLVTCFATRGSARGQQPSESREGIEGLVHDMGKALFFWAWPTADYDSLTFGGVTQLSDGGIAVSLVLHGRSGVDGGHLWTEVVLDLADGRVRQLHWGRNDAVIAQPGSTIKAMGEVLANLTDEYQKARSAQSQTAQSRSEIAGRIRVLNACHAPLRLAIAYVALDGQWKKVGWWSFEPGQGDYLTLASHAPVRSAGKKWYFYAQDDQKRRWHGDFDVTVGQRTVPMQERVDQPGDDELMLTCSS